MNQPNTLQQSRSSFRRTVTSLWDTLGLSVILGLVLMIIGLVGLKTDFNKLTGPLFLESVDSVIWPAIVCVAVAYGKLASKGDPAKTSAAGLGGALLAVAVTNLKGNTSPDLVDGVRVLFYPVLAWTVTRLERLHLKFAGQAWQVLAPLVLVPGLVIGISQDNFWAGLAEVVFAAGCAMILHAKKTRAQNAPSPAAPPPAAPPPSAPSPAAPSPAAPQDS